MYVSFFLHVQGYPDMVVNVTSISNVVLITAEVRVILV